MLLGDEMKTLEEQIPKFIEWAKKKYQFTYWGGTPLMIIKMWEEYKRRKK